MSFSTLWLWNRVSNKLNRLRPGLNPERSCFAFSWETSTSSNTCAGGDYGAFCAAAYCTTEPGTVLLQHAETWGEKWCACAFCWQQRTQQRQRLGAAIRVSVPPLWAFHHTSLRLFTRPLGLEIRKYSLCLWFSERKLIKLSWEPQTALTFNNGRLVRGFTARERGQK